MREVGRMVCGIVMHSRGVFGWLGRSFSIGALTYCYENEARLLWPVTSRHVTIVVSGLSSHPHSNSQTDITVSLDPPDASSSTLSASASSNPSKHPSRRMAE